jgi:hypothetical protein
MSLFNKLKPVSEFKGFKRGDLVTCKAGGPVMIIFGILLNNEENSQDDKEEDTQDAQDVFCSTQSQSQKSSDDFWLMDIEFGGGNICLCTWWSPFTNRYESRNFSYDLLEKIDRKDVESYNAKCWDCSNNNIGMSQNIDNDQEDED